MQIYSYFYFKVAVAEVVEEVDAEAAEEVVVVDLVVAVAGADSAFVVEELVGGAALGVGEEEVDLEAGEEEEVEASEDVVVVVVSVADSNLKTIRNFLTKKEK